MKYKLVLVDIDGTLAPNLGMPPKKYYPSHRMLHTVQQALAKTAIAVCSGRDKQTVLEIVNTLQLIAPQIIEGGAKIIDAKGKDLWVKNVSEKSALFLINLLESAKTDYSLVVDGIEVVDTLPDKNFDKITAILLYDLSPDDTFKLKEKLSSHPELAISVNQDRIGSTIYITHSQGTKSHGIKKLQEIMSISRKETIGVGDGNNDIQLLLSSGLKVAMGNAVSELKEIADFVAPSVEEDGVAYVLEKFIL